MSIFETTNEESVTVDAVKLRHDLVSLKSYFQSAFRALVGAKPNRELAQVVYDDAMRKLSSILDDLDQELSALKKLEGDQEDETRDHKRAHI